MTLVRVDLLLDPFCFPPPQASYLTVGDYPLTKLEAARLGHLHTIALRRFNHSGQRWTSFHDPDEVLARIHAVLRHAYRSGFQIT